MTYSFSGEKHAGKSGSEYTVRRLRSQEIPAALALTWEVFQQFEAPEYSQEGIDFFRSSLHDTQRIRAMRFYGAFDGDELVGTLCMRQPQHIGGFFGRRITAGGSAAPCSGPCGRTTSARSLP